MTMSENDRDRAFVTGRRDLIKWCAAAGVVLGLPRWKVFEVLERSGGKALAAQAACLATNRSVHLIGGRGGFAWFQLLWPHNEVAASTKGELAFHAPGQQVLASGTDRPLTFAPETPWRSLPPARQVTAMMGGTFPGHEDMPRTTSTLDVGTSLFGAASAMQRGNASLVPAISVGLTSVGPADGAPAAARVGTGADIVSLFDSAASRAGGALANPKDAALYDASYRALQGLHAAAGRPTTQRAFATGRGAAGVLGMNLASKLAPTIEDRARYGLDLSTRSEVTAIAETLIVTAKAFANGLTSCVVLPAMLDDPHAAFLTPSTVGATVASLGKVLDGFMADMAATEDPLCAGTTLADNLVVSIHGDTPKSPFLPTVGDWADGTPGNSNWVYVLGGGFLRTGWFGGVRLDGSVDGWDPTTGQTAAVASATTAEPAAAAIAYAIARGDMRRVRDFYRGVSIDGVIRPNRM
jgi:hypothetical protein